MIWYYSTTTWQMTKSRCVIPNVILRVNKMVFKIIAEIMKKSKYNPPNNYFTLSSSCSLDLNASRYYETTGTGVKIYHSMYSYFS